MYDLFRCSRYLRNFKNDEIVLGLEEEIDLLKTTTRTSRSLEAWWQSLSTQVLDFDGWKERRARRLSTLYPTLRRSMHQIGKRSARGGLGERSAVRFYPNIDPLARGKRPTNDWTRRPGPWVESAQQLRPLDIHHRLLESPVTTLTPFLVARPYSPSSLLPSSFVRYSGSKTRIRSQGESNANPRKPLTNQKLDLVKNHVVQVGVEAGQGRR
jgi:hypothetical protein